MRLTTALVCVGVLTLGGCTDDGQDAAPRARDDERSSARLAPQDEGSTSVCLLESRVGQQYGVSGPPVRALGGDVTLTGVELHASRGVELLQTLVTTPGPGAGDGLWTSDWPAEEDEDGGDVLDWSSRRPLPRSKLESGTAFVPVAALRIRPPAHFGGLSFTFRRPDGTTGTDVATSDVSFAPGTACDDQRAP